MATGDPTCFPGAPTAPSDHPDDFKQTAPSDHPDLVKQTVTTTATGDTQWVNQTGANVSFNVWTIDSAIGGILMPWIAVSQRLADLALQALNDDVVKNVTEAVNEILNERTSDSPSVVDVTLKRIQDLIESHNPMGALRFIKELRGSLNG